VVYLFKKQFVILTVVSNKLYQFLIKLTCSIKSW